MKIINEKILSDLCTKFNFEKPSLMGQYAQIKSKRDTWFVPNLPYIEGRNKIRLLHSNVFGSAGYHYQKSFSNYLEMFEYLKTHDNLHEVSYNKLFNLTNIFKTLEAKR